jgi:hypothetical protein
LIAVVTELESWPTVSVVVPVALKSMLTPWTTSSTVVLSLETAMPFIVSLVSCAPLVCVMPCVPFGS